MFVKAGARDLLLKGEREKFLADEWPRVAATIQRLGLSQKELDAAAKRSSAASSNAGAKSKTKKEER
jgi:GntR family transcriptional regulator